MHFCKCTFYLYNDGTIITKVPCKLNTGQLVKKANYAHSLVIIEWRMCWRIDITVKRDQYPSSSISEMYLHYWIYQTFLQHGLIRIILVAPQCSQLPEKMVKSSKFCRFHRFNKFHQLSFQDLRGLPRKLLRIWTTISLNGANSGSPKSTWSSLIHIPLQCA